MEIAVFLRESGDIDNEQWHKFSRRFFTEYRDTIMQYYGYESQHVLCATQGIGLPTLLYCSYVGFIGAGNYQS